MLNQECVEQNIIGFRLNDGQLGTSSFLRYFPYLALIPRHRRFRGTEPSEQLRVPPMLRVLLRILVSSIRDLPRPGFHFLTKRDSRTNSDRMKFIYFCVVNRISLFHCAWYAHSFSKLRDKPAKSLYIYNYGVAFRYPSFENPFPPTVRPSYNGWS